MSDDRTQIGPAVDADLWEEFRRNVEERKGQVRGVLADELENAIREYLNGHPTEPSEKIDKRLARIEQELGITATDGGDGETRTQAVSQDSHTHTDEMEEEENKKDRKPGKKAPRDEKAEWIFSELTTRDAVIVGPQTLRDTINEEFSLGSRAREGLFETVLARFESWAVSNNGRDWKIVLGRSEDVCREERDKFAADGEIKYIRNDNWYGFDDDDMPIVD